MEASTKAALVAMIAKIILTIVFIYLGAWFLLKGFIGGPIPFFSMKVVWVSLGVAFATSYLQNTDKPR